MPLQKSKGNMYPWVTHTHCHLGGQCSHGCSYCYVDHFPFGRPKKYQGELRLIEKEFNENYGSGKTIFIENCNDLFAKEVPKPMINKIIMHCLGFPENTYVFQTKNPARYLTMDALMPDNSLFGCTIESDHYYPLIMGDAPIPAKRFVAMKELAQRKFITIEPILDFDVGVFVSWIKMIKPDFVNIGADSKKHNLPEPTPDKIHTLIKNITDCGIEIREKHNLDRLLI
jgi:DNA repair photolyase